jgi:hypothetical protein
MSKVTIEVDEDAIEVLDAFIKSQYSRRCWIRNIGSENYWDERSDWERAEVDATKAKKLAKAFGLYPYNQKEVRHPQFQNVTPSKYGIS